MPVLTSVQPVAPAARAVRSVCVGTVVALCALVAHVGAGGAAHPGAVLGVAVVATLVAGALAGRRLATSQLLGLLLLGQAALHVAADSGPGGDAAMLLAHLAATSASLLLVRHGEDAWWRLADLALQHVAPPRLTVPPVPRTVAPAVASFSFRPAGAVVPGTRHGRAPPVGS